jgi:Integrase core domain/Chromo (CHRromatin Organisation MOdifier) domain
MTSLDSEIDDLLNTIYTDPANPAGFSSRDKLYKRALALDARIKRSDVDRYLGANEAYTMHRDLKRKYPRQPTLVPNIDFQWQADLVVIPDLAEFNDGYIYILTVIDVFSKYAFAEPLKKKTGNDMVKAFSKIFEESGRKPQKLQTDKGTEFLNSIFQSFLKREEIDFFTTNSDFKAAVCERFNRSLKGRMWHYFTQNNTRRYVEVLPRLMEAYNNAEHRTIGMEPSSVNGKNEMLVRKRLYEQHRKKVPKNAKPKFFVNQPVRLTILKTTFEKGYTGNWGREVFYVDKIYRQYLPFMYRVRDVTGEVVKGRFYELELQPVIERAEQVYKIEKIVKRRKRKGHPPEVLIKWLGYPDSANTWEPATSVIDI